MWGALVHGMWFLPLFLASMCLFTLGTLHGICLSGLATTHPAPCTPPLSTLFFFLGAIYVCTQAAVTLTRCFDIVAVHMSLFPY